MGRARRSCRWAKREVEIAAVEPVGSYAVRLVFSDGHDTGLYSWEYLHHLGMNQDRMWRERLSRATSQSECQPGLDHGAPRSERQVRKCQLPSSAPRLHHRLEGAVIRADMSAEVQR